MNYWIFWQCTFHFSTWHPTIAPNWLQMTVVPIFHLDLLFIVIPSYSTSFKLNVEWIELKWIDQYLIDQLTTKIANWCNSQVVKPVHPQKLKIWGMTREILIFQFSHLLLKRIIRIQELGKMLMSYKKTQVVNHRFQMCRHRAAIFCQLLGSPERNHRSPHLAASANHPVGGGVKRDGLKSGGETVGEGGRPGPCGRGWLDGGLAQLVGSAPSSWRTWIRSPWGKAVEREAILSSHSA